MRGRATLLGLASALGAVVLGAWGDDVVAAGRRPYGAALEIPVRDFSGLVDPHLVESRSGRLVASLVHGHLFRMANGVVVPELAATLGAWTGSELVVTLADSARFHDGRLVEPGDVIASWRRLTALADQSPIGKLAAAVTVTEGGPRQVVFNARGAVVDELRALLARPEAGILPRGQPSGVACGAFKPAPGDGERRTLVAWDGHAEGRPWLQEIRLRRIDAAREEAAFRFGEVELAFEPPRMMPSGASTVRGGWTSWLAIFHPRYRGAGGAAFRAWVQTASHEARLGRYVDGRSLPGDVPWPEPLAPIEARSLASRPPVGRDEIVVAYGDAEPDSAELAKALRDTLRPGARLDARVAAVRSLDLALARGAADPSWDVALVRWEWAALTRSQAAHELARALGMPGLAAADVLARKTGDWARGITGRVDALAIVHAERPATLHAKLRGVVAAGPLPGLLDAWSPNAGRP